jgi:hypothetical protein
VIVNDRFEKGFSGGPGENHENFHRGHKQAEI